MNKKTISIISYLTIFGWVISFIIYHNGGRSALAQYHLKQSFGLGVFGVIVSIIFVLLFPISPVFSILFGLVSLAFLIFLIFGVINAIKQKRKPVPLIGVMFVDRFHFIKY